jgi:hypothetical protein
MTIKIEGLEAIVKKLDSLNKPGVFKRPMTQSVQHLHRKIARPPVKQPGAFSRLATQAQKRAYWARVSSGEIQEMPGGGYRRTNQLKNSWTTKVSPDGRTGEVGTNIPYGRYVQGQWQQPFHKASNWPRVDKVVKEEAKTIIRFFQQAYERALK